MEVWRLKKAKYLLAITGHQQMIPEFENEESNRTCALVNCEKQQPKITMNLIKRKFLFFTQHSQTVQGRGDSFAA